MSQNKQIVSLFISNRSGGLMYRKNFKENVEELDKNLIMTIISTLHSLHFMTQQIAINPRNNQYMENIVIENGVICTHQSPTGVNFIVVAEGMTEIPQKEIFMQEIYSLYVDYVIKNPFYLDEQPFQNNSKEFIDRVTNLIREKNISVNRS